MATIETGSYGRLWVVKEKALRLEERVHELADEFGDQINFRSRSDWDRRAKPPTLEVPGPGGKVDRFTGPELAALVITIIGWVASPLVTKLIDKLFEKKEDTKNVIIQVIHQDSGIVFNLPAQNRTCLEYFRRLENSKPPSSAAG